jgi:hypothetical protein
MLPSLNRGVPARHYSITDKGIILLKGELKRMKHAVDIGKVNGMFIDELPLDMQELLLKMK